MPSGDKLVRSWRIPELRHIVELSQRSELGMSQSSSHLKERVLHCLAKILGPKGYKRDNKKRSQDFYKNISVGRYFVHLTFIDHNYGFDIVVNVSIRHDALVELVKQVNSFLTSPEGYHFAFVGAELGNISDGKQKCWTVVDENDVQEVCIGIMHAFETIGEPYLERFSSLEEILIATAGDNPAAFLHSPFHGTRAKTAVAAALLLGKQELFSHLVDQKTQYLKERRDFEISSFISFVEALRSIRHLMKPEGNIS